MSGLTETILPYVGGLAGATLLYFIIMVVYSQARYKIERRMELRQQRIERMTRDLWFDWLRRKRL